ncbi:unnamed protein product [Rhodiola kirilowii]
MDTEITALQDNNTWSITDLPQGKNAVGCKWIFKIKRKSDGTVERYKARLVAKGYTQLEGLDYHETFAPVVKMNTVRTLLAVAISKGWPLYQLDVNNAFLHGSLTEEVYMTLPPGFYKTDKAKKRVCKLHKSLYGLKQASRQWFSKFSEALVSYGFESSLNDYSLFTLTTQQGYIALSVYVDDIIITGTSQALIDQVKWFIDSKFKINQRKYALELIKDAGLLGCKPSSLPMDTKHKLSLSTSSVLEDPTKYRRLVGQLIYLTVTRPDLAYPVHVLSQYMHEPREDHLKAAHKVLRYLKLAPAQGLLYPANQHLSLKAYCDADWGACPITRRSVTGYVDKALELNQSELGGSYLTVDEARPREPRDGASGGRGGGRSGGRGGGGRFGSGGRDSGGRFGGGRRGGGRGGRDGGGRSGGRGRGGFNKPNLAAAGTGKKTTFDD